MKRVCSMIILLAAAQLAMLPQTASGRGFGGGGGGRGFSGGGYSGDRGGGYARSNEERDYGGERLGSTRDFDERADDFLRGGDAYGMGGRDAGFNAVHSDAFNNASRVSENDLRAGADQEYGSVKTSRALSTDSGFGGTVAGYHPVPSSYRMTPAAMVDRGNAVRSDFHDYDLYNRGWWDDHPNAWRYPYYGNSYWPWGYTSWGSLAGFWGMSAAMSLPEYDYGENITYNNNEIYYGSQPTCTADQYYQQAQTLAQSVTPSSTVIAQQPAGSFTIDGKPPDADSWKQLGVFSLTQGGQNNSTSLFQLAVDKDGTIRGNYNNELTGDVEPVQGAVDKKTMRAAWTVGDSKSVVYDTGVSNLMKAQAPVLVHFSKDRTEQWNLTRLSSPSKSPTANTSQTQPG